MPVAPLPLSTFTFTPSQWLLAILGALGIGLAKSGLSGIGLIPVIIFANLFPARDSTGVVLPMLIAGDLLAVLTFRQHARWEYIRRMLPPAITGVIAGWLLMHRLSETAYKPLIGAIILGLTVLQLWRMARPALFEHMPHSLWFAWAMGLLAGSTTMLINGAGPIMALYFVAVALPKLELVGTGAWYFLIVNCLKVPFSANLGLIHADTLRFNALLVPAVAAGLFAGRWLVQRIPQRLFDTLLLLFVIIAALRLIGVF